MKSLFFVRNARAALRLDQFVRAASDVKDGFCCRSREYVLSTNHTFDLSLRYLTLVAFNCTKQSLQTSQDDDEIQACQQAKQEVLVL